MGGMLVRGFLRRQALAAGNVWVANRSQTRLQPLASQFPQIHIAGTRHLAANCDLIFLCVKAGDTASVLAQMDAELYPGQLLLTTASTIPLKMLEDRVPCRVAKLIPSLTQEVGAGISLLMYGSRITADDRTLLEDLLRSISEPIVIVESQARPAISLSSGAPALIAYLIQSMSEEAARANPELPTELAAQLVEQTLCATVELMKQTRMSLPELIRRVATPGGMTEQSIEILSRYLPQAWQTVFRTSAEKERRDRDSLTL